MERREPCVPHCKYKCARKLKYSAQGNLAYKPRGVGVRFGSLCSETTSASYQTHTHKFLLLSTLLGAFKTGCVFNRKGGVALRYYCMVKVP